MAVNPGHLTQSCFAEQTERQTDTGDHGSSAVL